MTTATIETEIIKVAIDIPLGELPVGYESQQAARGRINFGRTHLQVQLKPDEAQMMLRIREGLIDSKALLENGQRVTSNADALRWLLAQMRSAAEQPAEQDSDDSELLGKLKEVEDENASLREALKQAQVQDSGDGEASGVTDAESEEPTGETQTNVQSETPNPEEEAIAEYLNEHGLDVTNKSVIEALRERDIVVQSPQVTVIKKQLEQQLSE